MLKHEYSYKPSAVFHGRGGRHRSSPFLGVELELQPREVSPSRGLAVLELDSKNWYCKVDGSLQLGGEEYVSHPRTLLSWRRMVRNWPFSSEIFSVPNSEYGMHVHADHGFLGFNEIRAALFMRKLLCRLCDDHRHVYRLICGREPNSWCIIGDDDLNIAHHYSGIGLRPKTLEFRVFRSTTHPDRFMARVEFVDAVMRYTKSLYSVTNEPNPTPSDLLGWIAIRRNFYPVLCGLLGEAGVDIPKGGRPASVIRRPRKPRLAPWRMT